MIRDTAAQNKSLDNDYGATKGANAPATHLIALFAGDPSQGGVELPATGGYARKSVTNNGTNWPVAAGGVKTSIPIDFGNSSAAYGATATYWAAFDAADGTTMWDYAALTDEVPVTAAGTPVVVTCSIFYDTNTR